MKKVIAFFAGYLLWSVLWVAGNKLFFSKAAEVVEAGEFYGETGGLLGVLCLSIVCSLAAGLVAARIARPNPANVGLILGVMLVISGILVQYVAWSQMPVWYHLTFLALLLPVTLLGARLAPAKKA